MLRTKSAKEIHMELVDLQDNPDAKNILFVDNAGRLIDFNKVYIFNAEQWTEDDIMDIENASPKKTASVAIEINERYK